MDGIFIVFIRSCGEFDDDDDDDDDESWSVNVYWRHCAESGGITLKDERGQKVKVGINERSRAQQSAELIWGQAKDVQIISH